MWHYAHKSVSMCDDWYLENEWSKKWMETFEQEYREVIVKNDGDNRGRIADVKYKKLVLKLQNKSLTGEEFLERVDFFNKESNLVWLVDVRDKDISYNKTRKTYGYVWKHAYKFGNLDKFNKPFYLFFQLSDDLLIRVVWNKEGFKYFGGYHYAIDEFNKFLIKVANDASETDIITSDINKFNIESDKYANKCLSLLEECTNVNMVKYSYKLNQIGKTHSYIDILVTIKSMYYNIKYLIEHKTFDGEKHKIMYIFKVISNNLEGKHY